MPSAQITLAPSPRADIEKGAALCYIHLLQSILFFRGITGDKGEKGMDIPLLELKDVTYALNGKNILDHVSWTVKPEGALGYSRRERGRENEPSQNRLRRPLA